jgi:cell division protein FtsB
LQLLSQSIPISLTRTLILVKSSSAEDEVSKNNHLHQIQGWGKIISMKQLKFSWKYAVIIVGVIFLAYLVMDFNNRMVNLRNLSEQRDRVAAQVTSLVQERSKLETQIAYATSEAAVVQWAYEEGRMVRPGDNPIIPLAPAQSTPAPTPNPIITQPAVEKWQVWIMLFVDKQ